MVCLNRLSLKVFSVFFWLSFIALNVCFSDSEVIKGFMSHDPLIRQKVHEKVIKERTDRVNELINLLETSKMVSSETVFHGTVHYAISTLGILRAKEAIPVLIKFLDFVPDGFEVDEQIPTEAYYVATEALIEIGSPAIKPLLNELLSDSVEKRQNAAWCLKNILELNNALVWIAKFKEQRSPEEREKIKSAEIYLKKNKLTFHHPKAKKD